jgi:hypothetical protein
MVFTACAFADGGSSPEGSGSADPARWFVREQAWRCPPSLFGSEREAHPEVRHRNAADNGRARVEFYVKADPQGFTTVVEESVRPRRPEPVPV